MAYPIMERLDSLLPELGLNQALQKPPDYGTWDADSVHIDFATAFDVLVKDRVTNENPAKLSARLGEVSFGLMIDNNILGNSRDENTKGGDPFVRRREFNIALLDQRGWTRETFTYIARSCHYGEEDIEYDEYGDSMPRAMYLEWWDYRAPLPDLAKMLGISEDLVTEGKSIEFQRDTRGEADVKTPALKRIFGVGIKIAECLKPEMFSEAA